MPLVIAFAMYLALPVPAQGQPQAAPTPIVQLGEYFGADVPSLMRPAATATGRTADWASAADYPAAALREGRSGVVEMLVSISAADRITACEVVGGVPDADLRETACAIVRRRGAFRHALGNDGRPRPGTVSLKMRFALLGPNDHDDFLRVESVPEKPGRAPRSDWKALVLRGSAAVFPDPRPGAFVNLSATGKVTRCKIVATAGTDAGDIAVCRFLRTRIRFEPAENAAGRKIPFSKFYVELRVER